ncbi:MAG TPA: PAS domain S-box protein [Solirubrobacteraceae bacterium]|nr:PAS domain S-box protein [Solirubrobacteraceae bacterium]
MHDELFDPRTFGSAEEVAEFVGNVLESSTEYSIVATDPAGLILLWNEGARRLYGYAPAEVIGQSWSLLHTEEDVLRGLPAQMMAGTLRDGKWQGTVARVRKDGSSFTAQVVTTLRKRADGQQAGFLLMSSDISEKVRLDRELDYARSLLELAPDAMVIVDADGTIQLANAATERMFGYSREALVECPVEMLIPDRYQRRHPEHRDGFFSSPRARSMGQGLDLSGRRQDGSEFPVEISLSPLDTEDGFLAMAAIRDVTERKRAEGKFRGLLESAPDAMVIVNSVGEIQLANAETTKLFGYRRDELIGRPVEMLIPLRYHDRHPDHRMGFFSAPQARAMGAQLDLSGRRKDGVEFPIEISLSPLETEDGMLATAAIRDVTKRKRAERDLSEANVQLENASRAKDRFLASMSHELRTPLNAILGFTGTLLMGLPGPLNDEQTKQMRTVRRSGRHLLSLINDLLDLARIESGKLELHDESIDCRDLLEEVAVGLRPLADEKAIALELAGELDRLELRSDRRALSQILINLANNAIKFTDKGSVRLGLSRRREDGDLVTRFSVTDTGHGIRVEDQERLFAAFEQIGGPDARPYEGTGLGLYICQTLAPLIGGAITFESEFDVGSTFALEITEQVAP